MLNCQFCKREVQNQGALNLHERACKSNPANNKPNEKPGKAEKPGKCEHNFVALNPRNGQHKEAINAGYSAYCTKCQDLL